MCCNGLKKTYPQLHVVTSTLSYNLELQINFLFFGICADSGLTVFGGYSTDVHAYSPVTNNM